MSNFYCDLEGGQKLQIWYITIGTMYQPPSAPELTPQQAKLELCVYNNPVVGTCDEHRYYAAFPYSPYLELELAADWLRANHQPWQRYEICQSYGEGADQNKRCPGCGSYDTLEDSIMVGTWRCNEWPKVWSYNAQGQTYVPY